MKRWLWGLLAALLCLGPVQAGRAQLAPAVTPPPEVASYTIAIRYDPETHQLAGEQTIRYTNRTDTPFPDLVFHLYLNAFRSEQTLWMREAGPGHRGFTFNPEHNGWARIESLALSDGTALTVAAVDADETLVRAELPRPIAPGETVTLQLIFSAQLPEVFARTGWADDGDFVMAGQWFPKLGVWEGADGWNAHPFRANNEFYADFGIYEVAITLPEGWITGASGVSLGEPERNDYGMETHHYRAEHVIDFAWTASPRYRELVRDVDGVTVRVLHYPGMRGTARRILRATEGGLRLYSEWYGPYGMGLYPHLTVVAIPPDAGGAGGMEYPTLFTVGAMGTGNLLPACVKLLEIETVHELGHQWFQSVVATNEAEEPWLDEGFTDYITTRAMEALHDGAMFDCGGWSFSYLENHRFSYAFQPDVVGARAAWEYNDLMEYAVATYSKPALALITLERIVGEEAMLDFMRAYYTRYAFAHPSTQDVWDVMAETLGQEMADGFFETWIFGSGTLDWRIAELGETEALVRRDGDACFPVTVQVERAGVAPEMRALDCDASEFVLDGSDAPLTLVQIDPDMQLLMDMNLANNGQQRTPDWAAWAGLAVRMTLFLQDLFLGGGATW